MRRQSNQRGTLSNVPAQPKTAPGDPTAGPAAPVVFVLHGPSGVGKDSIIGRLGVRRLTSTTDRAPRHRDDGHKDTEVDGVDYHFVSPECFSEMIAESRFAEQAGVYGHRKGLEWREILEAMESGADFIIRTDVQGARTWRERLQGCLTLLVVGVDPELPLAAHELDLRQRLIERKETGAEIRTRLASLPLDLQGWAENDYVVVNRRGGLDAAVARVKAILETERVRADRVAPSLRGT